MSVFTRHIGHTFSYDRDLECYIMGDSDMYFGKVLTNDTPGQYEEKMYNNLNKDVVNGDYVNAYLTGVFKTDTLTSIYKCVIPSGTPFYISDDLKEVAAKKLIVNEIVYSVPKLSDVLANGYVDCLRLDLFRGNPEDKIAYFVLERGGIINPYSYIGNGDDVIAIICNIHDGVAKVMALEERSLQWTTIENIKTKIVSKKPLKHKKIARQDLNGYQNTRDIIKSKKFNYMNYPAIQYCSMYSRGNYQQGRWFLGSAGDIVSMVRDNMLKINAALAILQYKGGKCDLLDYEWYWSSTEFHENSAWVVIANSGFLGMNVKQKIGGVRPMTIINLGR